MTLTWVRETPWNDENWRQYAICSGANSELFFPVGSTGHAVDTIQAAKEVCIQCPVAEPCLEFSLDTNQEAGVWGGYSEEERRAIRRERLSVASSAVS